MKRNLIVMGDTVYREHSNTWSCTVIDVDTNRPDQYIHGDNKEDAEEKAKIYAAGPNLLDALLAMDELDRKKHLSKKWWDQAEICDKLRNESVKKATS